MVKIELYIKTIILENHSKVYINTNYCLTFILIFLKSECNVLFSVKLNLIMCILKLVLSDVLQ